MLTRTQDIVLAHGMRAGLVTPDWPPLEAAEIAALAPHYPALRGAVAVLWHSPRPFSAAARLGTPAGEFFLKRHDPRVRDVHSLFEEHAFIGHLHARGLAVCAPVQSASGASAVRARTPLAGPRAGEVRGDACEAESCYEMFPTAAGVDTYRDAPSWTPVRSGAHAAALGRALAQLHLAAQGYEAPARALRPLRAGFDIVGAGDIAPALDAFVAQRPALADFLARQLPPWRAAVLEVFLPLHARLAPLLAELPPLWAHNDWHASNLFWTDRSERATVREIIDFGLCNRGCAAADLATALERNTIAWLDWPAASPEGGAIGRTDLAGALLAGYESLRPLAPAERAALPLLLAVGHAEFALSEVEYFHAIVRNCDNAALAYPDFLIGHARWFESRHGRAYLDGVRAALKR